MMALYKWHIQNVYARSDNLVVSREWGLWRAFLSLSLPPAAPLVAFICITTGTMFSICYLRKWMGFGTNPPLFSFRSGSLLGIAQNSSPTHHLLYSDWSFELPLVAPSQWSMPCTTPTASCASLFLPWDVVILSLSSFYRGRNWGLIHVP